MSEYKVELVIDEDVLKELEQKVVMRKRTGNFYGVSDEFLFLIVKGRMLGKTKLNIRMLKKRRRKDSKTKSKPKRQGSTGSKQIRGYMKAIKESSTNGRIKTQKS